MKKITTLFIAIILSIVLVNCKSEEKEQDFKAITDSYFDEK